MDACQSYVSARVNVSLDDTAKASLDLIQDHLRVNGSRGSSSEAVRFALLATARSLPAECAP